VGFFVFGDLKLLAMQNKLTRLQARLEQFKVEREKQDQPNSNDQKYYTTEAGKRILRLGKTE